MSQQCQGEFDARGRHPDHAGHQHEPVFGVRGFAALYILLGIDGSRVRVKRKCDGVVGSLAYNIRPLQFGNFRPASGGQRP